MKSRQEIKSIAKAAFRAQWGLSILLLVVVSLVGLVGSGVSWLAGHIPMIGWLLVLAIDVAISFSETVLSVNICGSFIKIYCGETTSIRDLFAELSVNFFRKFGGMLWMGLWTMLWSLLLVIPGIIKGIAYSMTPYILADCPGVTAKEALKLSMRMTKGHKGELVVFCLSFLGWALLVPITLGIFALVYLGPYASTALSGYYLELRDEAFATGTILPEEMGMYAISPDYADGF